MHGNPLFRLDYWFIYFSGSLVDSFCSLCLFFREIKRKALIGNDDVIVFMGMSLNYVMLFSKLFYRQLEVLICFSIKLSIIKELSNRNQCSVTSKPRDYLLYVAPYVL